MTRFVHLLLHPVVLALAGLVALGLIVWFLGPLIAIAGVEPLASPMVRALVITVLVLLYLLFQVWRLIRAKRENARLLAELQKGAEDKQAADQQAQKRREDEAADIQRRFQEAMKHLREARIHARGENPGIKGWLSARRGRYLYELPWYVFIGAPGSGKTTALLNAGLRFPFADKFGKQAVRGVGGTRACDWWFTDEAVMIDTAGRYTTQDSDRQTDRAGWQAFLAMLKRYRPRRPLNGILLTVSVSDLLRTDPAERAQHAATLQARLAEVTEGLGMRLPVYLMVTKTDLINGFSEFFGTLSREEREQVWGFTLEQGALGADVARGLQPHFDQLIERLEAKTYERLSQDSDPALRALIFGFPAQVAAVTPVLAEFIEQFAAPSRLGEAPMLRGVYFTSGTQEGTPIDRVMSALARTFRIQQRVVPPRTGAGRSYFLTRLLTDVVFAEQGLAGLDARRERRRRLARAAAFGATGLVAVSAVTAWSVSAWRNSTYVAQVDAQAKELSARIGGYEQKGVDFPAVAQVLASVSELAKTPQVEPGDPTLSYRFGLFQGEKLVAASEMAYGRLTRDLLLPPIATRLETELAQASGSDLESAYEALRIYLMLHDPARFSASAVKEWVQRDWERSLPREVTRETREQLAMHLDKLFEQGNLLSDKPADEQLVARVRGIVAEYSLAQRAMDRLQRQTASLGMREFTVSGAAGPAAGLVFERASREPLTAGIPGLYTKRGYTDIFKRFAPPLIVRLADEETWVMGVPGDDRDIDRLTEDLQRAYYDEYIRRWDEYLADVRVMAPDSLQRNIEMTRVLAQADSPLVRFMRAAARETELSTKQEPEKDEQQSSGLNLDIRSGRLGYRADSALYLLRDLQEGLQDLSLASDALRAKAATLMKDGLPDDGSERVVDDHFQPIRRLVTGDPPPITQTQQVLKELNAHLNAVDIAAKSGAAPPPAAALEARLKVAADEMPPTVRNMLQTLAGAGEAQAQGAAIAGWRSAYRSSVGDLCTKAVTGRYPFDRSSRRDVARDDFVRLFAPGGLFDQFFRTNLAAHVDTTQPTWTFRRIEDRATDASLAVFQNAAEIRDAFFPGGAQNVSLRFDLKLIETADPASSVVFDVDGRPLTLQGPNALPVAAGWPGPNGGAGARLSVTGTGGTASIQAEGPWALFRLFDQGKIGSSRSPERFTVELNVGGTRQVLEVTAGSVNNPFRLRALSRFRCAAL